MSMPGFVTSWTRGALPVASPRAAVCTGPPAPSRAARVRMGLSVKTETMPQSRMALEITAGPEECGAAWRSVLKDLSKRATIDGFRKGKAPEQLVINQYGRETIKASACEEVIEKSIQTALSNEGVSAIGQAVMDESCNIDDVILSYSPDNALTFKVLVDVWPEATLTGAFDGLEIEVERAPFDESVVEDAIHELQRKEAFSVLSPDGTKADIGNLVIADMVGFYRNDDGGKGDPLPDIASGDMIEIKMKVGQYMPGFVEGVIGMACGESRSVNVEFPAASSRPELAGRKAIFEVAVHAIKDEVLPPLDDEFAKQATESASMVDLRDTLRARLSLESNNRTEMSVDRAIEDALVEITSVTLPETMVEERVKTKFANFLSDMKTNGMSESQVKAMVTKENYELYKGRARGNVERALVANFAITTIAELLDVKATDEEIEDQMTIIRAEVKGQDIEEQKIKDQVQAQLERDMVMRHIKKTAKITYTEPVPQTPETAAAPAAGA
jgi:trigger factor